MRHLTPEEAKRLLEGTTPGPWHFMRNRHPNTDGTPWAAAAPTIAAALAEALAERDALRADNQRLLVEIGALHHPRDEEAELWDGEDGHDERFPECPSVAGTGDCEGHTFTMKVCQECGYTSDFDHEVAYRPWPCPTARAALSAQETL